MFAFEKLTYIVFVLSIFISSIFCACDKDENKRINRKHNLIIIYTLFIERCTLECEKSGEIFDLYLNPVFFGLFLDCVECNSRLCAVYSQ